MTEEQKPVQPQRPGFGAPDTPEQTALRAEAKALGIPIRGRPKAERMRQIIDEAKAQRAAAAEVQQPAPPSVQSAEPVLTDAQVSQGAASYSTPPAPPANVQTSLPNTPSGPPGAPTKKLYYTKEEWEAKQMQQRKHDVSRLVRCRITCMNPNKKDWSGEIVSVGSAKVGTFKKFIPYQSDEPYHIPWIIFQHLKERECAIRTIAKAENGRDVVITKMVKEFAIEELPPLTAAELDDMRKRQAMARGA